VLAVRPRLVARSVIDDFMPNTKEEHYHAKVIQAWRSCPLEFRGGAGGRRNHQKLTSKTRFKGYVRHASKDEPQYMIKSDKTGHIAIHKGSALRLVHSGRKTQTKRKAA